MSGSNSKIDIGISATGTVAQQIAEITKQLDKLKTPAERAGQAVGKFADDKKISSLASGMMDVSRASFGAFMNMSRMVAPLGALTSAASIAGLARMTQQWADAGVNLGTAAKRANVGTEQLSRWQGAAYLAGSSAQGLTTGVTALNDSLTKAANGTSPQAIMAFGAIGMAFRNADGSVRDASEAFPDLIKHLHDVPNPTLRAARAADLLGGSAEELMPVINGGADAFARYTQQATKAGSMTQHQVDVARDFQLAQRDTTLAVGGLANAIEEKTSPALAGLLRDVTKWIEGTNKAGVSNRELVANDVAGWATAQIAVFNGLAGAINAVVAQTVGWKTTLEGIEGLVAFRLLVKMLGAGRLAGPLTPTVLGAIGAHEALSAIDPQDRGRKWMDRNVPGYSWLDDWTARHLGLGRTYEQQGVHGGASDKGGGPAATAPAPPANDSFNPWPGPNQSQSPGAGLPHAPPAASPPLPPPIPGTASDRAAMWRNIQQYAGALGVPPAALWGLYDAESGYGRNNGPSRAGAMGPFQFMPETAQRFGVSNPMNIGMASSGAAQYLAWLRDHYGGDWRKVIAGYNWGEKNVDADVAQWGNDWLKHIPVETQRELGVVGRHFDYDKGAGIPGRYPGGPGAGLPTLKPGGGKDGYGDGRGMTDYGGFLGMGKLFHNTLPYEIGRMLERIGPSGPPASIGGGSGKPTQTGSNDTTVKGQATVHLKLDGFPSGIKVMANTSGALFAEGGRALIEQVQVGKGGVA